MFACGGDDDDDDTLSNNHTVTTLGPSFEGSGGVAVDADGNIYVGDFGNQLNNADGTTVKKLTPDGTLTTFAEGLSGASGNEFDSEGNLYQANIAGNRISKITPDGTVSTLTSRNLQGPVGIAIDGEDNLYVCNCGGNSLAKITPDGTSEIFVSNPLFNCPNGIAIDDQGNLYPVNFSNGLVLKVAPDGSSVSRFADLPGDSNAHITFANGRLYVVARSVGQVYEVSLTGEITLIAGTAEAGNEDGPALESSFFIPNGIEASPDGTKLYVTSRVVGEGSLLNPVLVRVINLNN